MLVVILEWIECAVSKMWFGNAGRQTSSGVRMRGGAGYHGGFLGG